MFQAICIAFVRCVLRAVLRIRLHYHNGTPPDWQKKPCLVVSNHVSYLDGLLLALFLPKNTTFVVHRTVVNNYIFRLFLFFVPHITIDAFQSSNLKTIIGLLKNQQWVVMFPEGRISTSGGLMKIYDGCALVAEKAGAHILNVFLRGPEYSTFAKLPKQEQKKTWRYYLPQVDIYFGEVRSCQDIMGTDIAAQHGKDKRQKMTRYIEDGIKSLAIEPQHASIYAAMTASHRKFIKNRVVLEDIKSAYTHKKLQKMITFARYLSHAMRRQHAATNAEHDVCVAGVLLPNGAFTVAYVLALQQNGDIPAMINYTAGLDACVHSAKESGVRYILTSKTFVEKANLTLLVQTLAEQFPVMYVEDFVKSLHFYHKLYALSLWKWLHPARPGRIACILFTSGSENLPKSVVLSHHNILSNIAQIKANLDFTHQERFFNALPMFHTFGLTAGVFLPLVAGNYTFQYPSALHYKVIPEVVYDQQCHVLFGTSTFLRAYAQQAHVYDFAHLRYVVAGAEKLQDAVRQLWLDKFGIRILEGYGVSEASPVLAVNTRMHYKIGSVGRLLPHIKAHILPVDGIEEGGRLCVQAPNIMLGYLKNQTIQAVHHPILGENWYDTGDIVELDAQGFVTIKGRAKRFAKIAGEMVSLEKAEALAQLASPGAKHACIAVEDAQKGERLVLFTQDAQLTRAAMIQAAQLHAYTELCIPKTIEYLAEIPLLGSGKTDYVSLQKR